jgi:hypothetical protein
MVIDNITIVEDFLSDFFQKKKIFGIRFENRPKNTQGLFDLEMIPNERIKIIDSLKSIDYSEGPNIDKMGIESDLWIFGKIIKNREVYIKITMGTPNDNVICISFHLSEYPMRYPFKSL